MQIATKEQSYCEMECNLEPRTHKWCVEPGTLNTLCTVSRSKKHCARIEEQTSHHRESSRIVVANDAEALTAEIVAKIVQHFGHSMVEWALRQLLQGANLNCTMCWKKFPPVCSTHEFRKCLFFSSSLLLILSSLVLF